MICTKLSISADNDAKDAMRVHKLHSTETELFWAGVYRNHEKLGLEQFGIVQRIYRLDLLVDSCNSDNEFLPTMEARVAW
jgi:hypothetical protein